jgi:hypothetical protein
MVPNPQYAIRLHESSGGHPNRANDKRRGRCSGGGR